MLIRIFEPSVLGKVISGPIQQVGKPFQTAVVQLQDVKYINNEQECVFTDELFIKEQDLKSMGLDLRCKEWKQAKERDITEFLDAFPYIVEIIDRHLREVHGNLYSEVTLHDISCVTTILFGEANHNDVFITTCAHDIFHVHIHQILPYMVGRNKE